MTTVTLATVRAGLKTRFEAIAGIGIVHDYERYTREASKLAELYKTTVDGQTRLRGMHFRLRRAEETFTGLNRWHVYRHWAGRFFMAIDDADESEKLFDNVIEAIQDSFRADPYVPGTANQVQVRADEDESGIVLAESAPVLFCGVVCHAANLTFRTEQLE